MGTLETVIIRKMDDFVTSVLVFVLENLETNVRKSFIKCKARYPWPKIKVKTF